MRRNGKGGKKSIDGKMGKGWLRNMEMVVLLDAWAWFVMGRGRGSRENGEGKELEMGRVEKRR